MGTKSVAEYFRICLIHGIVETEAISNWADEIIRENKESIPDWALDLTFAKSKSINEVISLLTSVEGQCDLTKVLTLIVGRVVDKAQHEEMDFKSVIRMAYKVLQSELNFFGQEYPPKVRELYIDLMRLDDGLDLVENEAYGTESELEIEYKEFIRSHLIEPIDAEWPQ